MNFSHFIFQEENIFKKLWGSNGNKVQSTLLPSWTHLAKDCIKKAKFTKFYDA